MLAFTMSLDQLELFYDICSAVGAKTEQQRVQVALEMANNGHVKNIVKTDMSKEDYIEHLAKHFGNVLELKSEKKQNG